MLVIYFKSVVVLHSRRPYNWLGGLERTPDPSVSGPRCVKPEHDGTRIQMMLA
jgi:hypothetical protein